MGVLPKTSIRAVLAVSIAAAAFCGSGGWQDGWAPKFYNGLEAAGDVVFEKSGFKGCEPAVVLRWTGGMPKFGVSKSFRSSTKGVQDWSVSAQVKCNPGGRVAVAAEFFDALGRSLGVEEGYPRRYEDWTPVEWKLTSPRQAVRSEIHLLSLEKEPVAFARVKVASVPGIDKNDIPFAMKVLPAEWNRDWNGGRFKMLSFSDAPLPMTILMRGDRSELKKPALEIDIPDELELLDAYSPHRRAYGRETPVSVVPLKKAGLVFRRVRFESLRWFERMDAVNFKTDSGGGIALIVGPKAGGEQAKKTLSVTCRVVDCDKVADERTVDICFRPLPKGIRASRNFMAFGWNNADRVISADTALLPALKAYEAAGIRMMRVDTLGGDPSSRVAEIRRALESRPCPYVFATLLPDAWYFPYAKLTKEELYAMGGNLSVTVDKAGLHRNLVCPQFFTTNEKFIRHLEDKVFVPSLRASGVKDGDWVLLDMEPWQSNTYCYCPRCLKAFGEFANMDHVPTVSEAQSMPVEWAEFRVRHTARTIEINERVVHRYNPNLKVVDYDYIIKYGDPNARRATIQSCAKDSLMDEAWIDGHICSYYHRIGKSSFEAMRNNTRNLRKFYIPMAGLSGYTSWLRPGEVLNPKQVRQFALAAFVNGCPGYGFYSGNCIDGEMLLAMMDVQDIVSRYEGLPWGKADGKIVAKSKSSQFAYASTTGEGGADVVALFNYDTSDAISVDVCGDTYDLPPLEVMFVERQPLKNDLENHQ